MAWYLKWPANSGSSAGNNNLCQVSGIAGTGSFTVAIEFAEDVVDPNTSSIPAYIYDSRRTLNSLVNDLSNRYLLENGLVTAVGLSGFLLNGGTSSNTGWRTARVGDVYSFVSSSVANGVISIGARFNETEHFWDLALRSITITDAAGNHTIDMSVSGGVANEFTSTDGALTLKLFNFDGSQWIFYDDGSGATYTITADGVSWSYSGVTTSLLFDRQLTADGAEWQHQGGSASTLYGRSMQAGGFDWSYSGGAAALTYTGGATAYVMIADGGSWAYYGADAGLLASRKLAADGSSWQYQSSVSNLLLHRKVLVDGSSWQCSFEPAALFADRRLTASGTSCAYSGGAASLNYSGAVTLQINGYTVSYDESAVSAAFGASPVTATYTENLRAEYGNV